MNKWTEDWPTEPGHYWFYGTPYRSMDVKLSTVTVHKVAHGVTCIGRGVFIYHREAKGVWQRIPTPELPND
jgi:hypothetical protein